MNPSGTQAAKCSEGDRGQLADTHLVLPGLQSGGVCAQCCHQQHSQISLFSPGASLVWSWLVRESPASGADTGMWQSPVHPSSPAQIPAPAGAEIPNCQHRSPAAIPALRERIRQGEQPCRWNQLCPSPFLISLPLNKAQPVPGAAHTPGLSCP